MSGNYYIRKRCIDVVSDYDDDFDDDELDECVCCCNERDEGKTGKNNFYIGRVGIGTRNRL